ncbi:hypothetical protein COU15_00795 [Candidatus Kaiserbacteria bacterium CG10_big_fil_rev_8_21_14_0_10_45_20]|uniref:NAD-dependent epimerase/dehydratase domain-containing protein n=1 Tax=Candidatus Kaiserbacteria bacterium CG10_big_fil_rev_8_21_14_0_10_45_20 TaxID=1974607 RepID=A0A2H0UGD4_9BACT|nr:MAG: hypothetical protein COU15_00795 [Candidatus Kaiserbacteria bacterium CG10_big_fil_rev_8_21_14_0_10_45_20]
MNLTQNKKAVVTGGAGFIGSRLVRALLDQGFAVTVIDDLSAYGDVRLLDVQEKITFLKESILKKEVLLSAFDGADVVFHLAAVVSVQESINHPERTNEVNCVGTFNAIDAARIAKVPKFVFSSSASVYGDTPELPKKENGATKPLSPYGVSKLIGEEYVKLYSDLYGMSAIALRYMNAYGPGQDPNGAYAAAIPKFISAVENSQPITIFGDGKQTRDFVFVDDIVRANILASQSDNVAGHVINIGTGKEESLLSVIEILKELWGEDFEVLFEDVQQGDIHRSFANVTKAKELLGFEAKISLKEGISLMIKL